MEGFFFVHLMNPDLPEAPRERSNPESWKVNKPFDWQIVQGFEGPAIRSRRSRLALVISKSSFCVLFSG